MEACVFPAQVHLGSLRDRKRLQFITESPRDVWHPAPDQGSFSSPAWLPVLDDIKKGAVHPDGQVRPAPGLSG